MFDDLPKIGGKLLAAIQGTLEKPTPPDSRSIRERALARSRLARESSGGDYGQAALERELGYMKAASKGTRNHALNKAAFSLFQLVQEDALDEWAVTEALSSAAREVGLTPQEITQTLASARDGAAKHPRSSDRLPGQQAQGLSRQGAPAGAIRAQEPADPDDEDSDPGFLELLASHLTLDELEAEPDSIPLVGSGDFVSFMLDSLALIWGPGGSKKSFAMLDLALCIANGMYWHGQPVVQGPVVYFVGEGVKGLKKRSRAWHEYHGLSRSPNFHLYKVSFDLMNRGRRKAVHATKLVQMHQPVFTALDTLHRHSLGANENDSRDIGSMIESMDEMRKASEGCVAGIHHSRKDGTTERGHSSLYDAVDTSVEVQSDDVQTTLSWRKQRDADKRSELVLYTHPVEGTKSIVLTDKFMGTDPQAVEHALDDRVYGELELFHGTGGTVKQISKETGLDEAAVSKTISRLLSQGKVVKEGQYGWKPVR